jgi:hypothetical protein
MTQEVQAMAQVQWLQNLDEALARAQQANKLVALDFFSPT